MMRCDRDGGSRYLRSRARYVCMYVVCRFVSNVLCIIHPAPGSLSAAHEGQRILQLQLQLQLQQAPRLPVKTKSSKAPAY